MFHDVLLLFFIFSWRITRFVECSIIYNSESYECGLLWLMRVIAGDKIEVTFLFSVTAEFLGYSKLTFWLVLNSTNRSERTRVGTALVTVKRSVRPIDTVFVIVINILVSSTSRCQFH